jgi:hypothetical protein
MPGIFTILLNFCCREVLILRLMEPAVIVYLRGTRKYIGLGHFFPREIAGSAIGATPHMTHILNKHVQGFILTIHVDNVKEVVVIFVDFPRWITTSRHLFF